MGDTSAIVDEEMEEIKKDPRYKTRGYYETCRFYLSWDYIKSLTPLGKYIYFTILILAVVLICIIIYTLWKGSRQVRLRILIGILCIVGTYIASRFLIPG